MKRIDQVPEPILDAAAALLRPHGIDIRALAENGDTGDTVRKRYLSVAEAEVYSGLGRWTLGRLAKSGQLPVSKLNPGTRSGKVLIDRADLDKFMRRHRTRGGDGNGSKR